MEKLMEALVEENEAISRLDLERAIFCLATKDLKSDMVKVDKLQNGDALGEILGLWNSL